MYMNELCSHVLTAIISGLTRSTSTTSLTQSRLCRNHALFTPAVLHQQFKRNHVSVTTTTS